MSEQPGRLGRNGPAHASLGLLSTRCVELVWAGRGPGTTKGIWASMRRRAKTDGAPRRAEIEDAISGHAERPLVDGMDRKTRTQACLQCLRPSSNVRS